MRGRSCLLLYLLVQLGCGPPGEPQAETPITLEPRVAQESPGPPTTLRLVLQLQPDGRVQLISSTAKRGSIAEPPPTTRQDAIDGRLRLIEYVARDAAGQVVATGRFTMPAVAVAEFQDPNGRTRIRRREEPLATPTVRVSIPFRPSISTISFERLEPDPDAPTETWKRTPFGEVTISPMPLEQAPPPAQQAPPQ